ncbi:MAG: hypothetical protein ABI175_03300 [Polyangiales bacterium]
MRVACPKCGREIHQVARHCKHCHAVVGRRDLMDEPVVPVEVARRRRALPIAAVALAAVAGVLLVVALVRRGAGPEPVMASDGSGDGSGNDQLGKPSPETLVDPAIVAMFGAVCRFEVGCGVGTAAQCEQIERTMRQMPKKLSIKSCPKVNEDLAKQCVKTLETWPSCREFAKSLAIVDLQDALDRVTPCRRACEP